MIISGRFYAVGEAEGSALVLSQALSAYGGIDVETGEIIDHSHPDRGASTSGRILVMPGARGSSSSSSVMAEVIRRGTGPVALILGRPDSILTVACLVARSLYGLKFPLVVCPLDGIAKDARVRITRMETGEAQIVVRPPETDRHG